MPTEEELRKAYKAFKKRLKLTQLDEDSKLGAGAAHLSKQASRIVAIAPPPGYGKEVWEALVDRGVLRRDGIGFYALVEGRSL